MIGYLRLSLMASDIGRVEEASHWVRQALAMDSDNADAIIVEGTSYGLFWPSCHCH